MDNISNWIFHLNPITNNWEATTRDNYNDLFSNNKEVLKSKDINILIELIEKTNGDPIKINKLLENN